MHRSAGNESGFSMPDLLIGMMLSVIVVALISAAMAVATHMERHTAEDSQALASLRASSERLSKELRKGKRLYSDSNTRKVHFWVENNGIVGSQPGERITWEIRDNNAGQAVLVRYTDEDVAANAPPATWAQDLVLQDVFSYRRTTATGGVESKNAAPLEASVVTINLVADAAPERRASAKALTTEVRLRNVA